MHEKSENRAIPRGQPAHLPENLRRNSFGRPRVTPANQGYETMRSTTLCFVLSALVIGANPANAQDSSELRNAAQSETADTWDIIRRRNDPVGFIAFTQKMTRNELDGLLRIHETMQADLSNLADDLDRKREEQAKLDQILQTLKTHLLDNSFPLRLDEQIIHTPEQAERLVSDQLIRFDSLQSSIDNIRSTIRDADAQRGVLLKRIEDYRVQLLLLTIRKNQIKANLLPQNAPALQRQLRFLPPNVPAGIQSHRTEVLQFLHGEQ
jgi:hypothetical protein